jgi:hypothetical protein
VQATILSAVVRRPLAGPDRVVLETDNWGQFELDVPRGSGTTYAEQIGLGVCTLREAEPLGWKPTQRVELGPKARPVDAKPVVKFARAQVTEAEENGPVVLVLDTRDEVGSNEGVYEHDFELKMGSLEDAKNYLAAHGFSEYVLVKMRRAMRGKVPRVNRHGKYVMLMLPGLETLPTGAG